MQHHSFSILTAQQVGVNAAIIHQSILYWLAKNKSEKHNQRAGRTWTYCSITGLTAIYPYLTSKQIRTAIAKLLAHQLIIADQLGGSDRTAWYTTPTEEELCTEIKPNSPPPPKATPTPKPNPEQKQPATPPESEPPNPRQQIILLTPLLNSLRPHWSRSGEITTASDLADFDAIRDRLTTLTPADWQLLRDYLASPSGAPRDSKANWPTTRSQLLRGFPDIWEKATLWEERQKKKKSPPKNHPTGNATHIGKDPGTLPTITDPAAAALLAQLTTDKTSK